LLLWIANPPAKAEAVPAQAVSVAANIPPLCDMGLQGFFTATLSGAQEVPPNPSTATGAGTFGLDAIGTLTYSITYTYTDIFSETAAHIHQAPPGVNGLIIHNLGTGSPKTGVFTPTLAQLAELKAGNLYVNIHTQAFPGGEIRGQLVSACQPTIQNAINAANPGDTIVVPPGVYTESLTLSKPVSITGASADSTIIRALSGERVITVTGATISNTVVISGVTFAGGNTPEDGGGMLVTDTAQPLLQNVVISDNVTGGSGGGLFAHLGSSLILNDVKVISNTAGADGGGVYGESAVTMTGGHFENNHAPALRAGGLFALGSLTLSNTRFISNSAAAEGGGLYAADLLTLTNTQFLSNTSNTIGGGAYVAGTGTLAGGLFRNNTATSDGGGLYTVGPLVLTGTQFLSNTATFGNGAGLYAIGPNDSLVQNSLFQDNSAGDEGGGLFINNAANFNVVASRILANQAANDGGGMYLTASTVGLTNTVIAANTSVSGTEEITLGAIPASSSLTGWHNTFASATPSSGTALSAGDDNPNDVISMTNTILDGYAVGVQTGPFSATINLNYVLWSNVTTQAQGSGITVTNPFTGSAAFANPAARDYHLGSTSAAIDKGVNAGVATDVDGDARPQGGGFDLGFDEFMNHPPTISDIPDQTGFVNTPVGPISFMVGDLDVGDVLTVTGASTNTALVPNANIVFGGSGITRTVTITPTASLTGTTTITVTVSDASGATAQDSFALLIENRKLYFPIIFR
jgi:predicted outer membrane repeat protein